MEYVNKSEVKPCNARYEPIFVRRMMSLPLSYQESHIRHLQERLCVPEEPGFLQFYMERDPPAIVKKDGIRRAYVGRNKCVKFIRFYGTK